MKRYIKRFIRNQNSIEMARLPLWKLLTLIVAISALCVYVTSKWQGKSLFTVVQKVEAPLAVCSMDTITIGSRVRQGKDDYLVSTFSVYKSWGEISIRLDKVEQ